METIALAISNELAVEDRDAIVALFEPSYEAIPSGARMGPGWAEWFLVLNDIAPAFSTSASILSLITGIISWRKATQSKGGRPAAQLTADGDILDLAKATDEDIAEWVKKRVKMN